MLFGSAFLRIFAAVAILLLCNAKTQGQDSAPTRSQSSTPTIISPQTPSDLFEVSVGFDYLRAHGGLTEDFYGFDLSGFVNFNSWLAFGGEFMGAFGTATYRTTSYYTFHLDEDRFYYVFGPRLTFWRNSPFRVFGEVMAGSGNADQTIHFYTTSRHASANGFAAIVGLGADWKFARHWSWRVLEADYLPTNFPDDWDNNFRLATGITYSFGGK